MALSSRVSQNIRTILFPAASKRVILLLTLRSFFSQATIFKLSPLHSATQDA